MSKFAEERVCHSTNNNTLKSMICCLPDDMSTKSSMPTLVTVSDIDTLAQFKEKKSEMMTSLKPTFTTSVIKRIHNINVR